MFSPVHFQIIQPFERLHRCHTIDFTAAHKTQIHAKHIQSVSHRASSENSSLTLLHVSQTFTLVFLFGLKVLPCFLGDDFALAFAEISGCTTVGGDALFCCCADAEVENDCEEVMIDV